MAGSKSVYYCQNCGTRSATWLGRCNVCGQWNTFVEEVIQRSPSKKRENVVVDSQPQLLKDITGDTSVRISSGIGELDRVLGGGIVQGSIILLGGDPGIGKSTLMLQLALNIKNTKVLYVSGEESATQIKLRASRMQLDSGNCYIVNETSLQAIFSHIDNIKPNILIIDSIQTLQTDTLDSSAGSISQIRETASELQRYAKQTATTIFLIGHITKDGVLAGPKVLEPLSMKTNSA